LRNIPQTSPAYPPPNIRESLVGLKRKRWGFGDNKMFFGKELKDPSISDLVIM
jgi:hypothetical protein